RCAAPARVDGQRAGDPLLRPPGAGEPGGRLPERARRGADAHRDRGAVGAAAPDRSASRDRDGDEDAVIGGRLRSGVAAGLALVLALAPRLASGQERGAAALDQLLRGITVTGRVLMVAAHPDDEDTNLLATLARG